MPTKEVLERLKGNITNTIGSGAATVLNEDLRKAMYEIRDWVTSEIDKEITTTEQHGCGFNAYVMNPETAEEVEAPQ